MDRKRILAAVVVGLMSLAGVCVGAAGPSAPGVLQGELRGYGRVSAAFAPGRAEFNCESPEKAEIIQGKLLADLLWDAAAESRSGKAVQINGIKTLVYEVPSHGAIVVGRLDGKVVALGGADTAEVARLAAKEEMFRDSRCRFGADKPYPIYLDFFDLSAVKMYTYAMQSQRGQGLSSHWPFLRKVGLNGIAYNLGGGMIAAKSPAPGILNFVDTDFEFREAEKNKGMIVPGISTGGALPVGAMNLFPESMMRLSPTGIGEDDHTLRIVEGYGMPREEREMTGLWSLRETMRRYQASPAIGGWQVFDGPAGIEVLHSYQQNTGFSKSDLKDYRDYLQEVKGLDLKAVGLRYHNEPGYFKSWDEVMPLDANGFVGNLDETCLLLKNWQWQPAEAAATQPPAASSGKWQNLTFPGSEQMHTLPEADAFYRIDFDATQWLAENANKELYLITGRMRARKPSQMKVWLNGKYLGEQARWDTASKSRSVAVKVNGELKPGKNELQLWIPKGKFLSPFFLTTHKAEEYPSSDKTLNARYVDLRDWQYDRIGARHRDAFELARSIDPDRSFIFPAGTGWEVAGDIADIATRTGSSVQNTGREVYQPWWPRLGRIAGFYGSSEPGSTVTPDINKPMSLNYLFGTILLDGDASHILYWQIEDYMDAERTGWLTRNKRLLSLVGKSLALPPEIAILRSSQTLRYMQSPEDWSAPPWQWDIGRGEINGAHYNWGYSSERELRLGLPKTCKVVFDSGSEVMDAKTVDAIASFVSDGGTFVALHNTGMHDAVAANSWPISRLTGCKVVGQKTNGKLRFATDLPVFRGWDGRELETDGIALDSGGDHHARDKSDRLSPLSGETQVLAKWDDGTAAITSRRVGKGRVICLGSTFWRSARDKNGVWFTKDEKLGILEQLFIDLGVERRSDASSSAVWINDSITKNGLEQWLITFNSTREPQTVDIKFLVGARPAEVRELTSARSVPFDYADGWVHLKNVDFDNTQTKVFSAKRANMADGIPFWWAEKTSYWKKAEVAPLKDEARNPGKLETIKLDSWKFLADRDGAVSAQSDWRDVQFADDKWETMETGPWNSLKPALNNFRGNGLYRASFSIPADWKGSSVSLNLYGDRAPKIFGDAEFFVNGKKIEAAAFQNDLGMVGYPARIVIDDLLAGKTNLLAVKIKGGANVAGEVFSGFGGTVYLAREKPLNPVIDLGGQWAVVRENQTQTPVSFPVAATEGKYIAKEFKVPASWKGRQIYIRMETATPWIEGIMFNGKLLLPAQFRRMGRFVEWNVTPWVEPGQQSRIELWTKSLPLFTPPDSKKPSLDREMDLLSCRIGCAN